MLWHWVHATFRRACLLISKLAWRPFSWHFRQTALISFAFEHAPVREDCVSCHEPHGTNHPRLVKQKLPTLCWNCHFTSSGHFGNAMDNLNTEKGVPVAPAGTTAYPTRNSRFVERGCRNCHVKIHGSNHPSGAYFLR